MVFAIILGLAGTCAGREDSVQRKVFHFDSSAEPYVADAAVLCCFDERIRMAVNKFLRKRGILLAMMDGRIRACTHLDVTAPMIEETVGLVREIARNA